MGFSIDFFTTDIPDQDTLVFYRLVNVVPRLKEIQQWLDWLLDPFDRGIATWSTTTEEERLNCIDYITDHDWDGLATYVGTLFPDELPEDIEQIIEEFLYGYYFDTLEVANTLAIGIDADSYQYLYAGMKVQYKPSRVSKDSTIYTLGNRYELVRWRKQVDDRNPLYYEVWAVFYYENIDTGQVYTWQYMKDWAKANRAAFGGEIHIRKATGNYGPDNTFYVHTYESTWWAAIGTRRETFLPVPTHYYDHDVDPSLIYTTDPATRGGMYSAYTGGSWEYHTDHPDTMGTPWAGDEGEKTYDDDWYDWVNVTVNPPGFTDLTHNFLLNVKVEETFWGEGKDPSVYYPPGGGIPPILGGVHGGHLPLRGLVPIFRRKKRSGRNL